MTATAGSNTVLVEHDDRGAKARRTRRKIVSYTILISFGLFYIGPVFMLVGASIAMASAMQVTGGAAFLADSLVGD